MTEVKFGDNKTEISISNAAIRYAERHCPCETDLVMKEPDYPFYGRYNDIWNPRSNFEKTTSTISIPKEIVDKYNIV